MEKKYHSKNLALPGKEYFLKNPEGFLFNHLFASGSVQDRLTSLLKQDVVLTPVSLQFAAMSSIRSFGKSVAVTVTFPAEFPGEAVTVFPLGPLKKLSSKAKIEYTELLQHVNEPVGAHLSQLTQKTVAAVTVTCKYADMKTYPVEKNGLCLWIQYHWEAPGIVDFFSPQCISTGLLSSFCRHFLGDEVSSEIASDDEKLLALVRALNRRFQERLFESISSDDTAKIKLDSPVPVKGEPAQLNLEELRLVDDRTIRAILEEVSRKRVPMKSFVYALSGMSEDLRVKFLHNMSRNRRADIREGLSLWGGTEDEVMEAQRDLAWIIINLVEDGEVKVNKRFQKQLETIIQAMDAALMKSAEEYIKSNRFGESFEAINGVLLQLLLRRVPRKVLIPALSLMQGDTAKKISENMTPFFMQLLDEDVEHWQRKTENEIEKLISIASAQKTIIRTAIKLKREFTRSSL